MQDVCDGRTAAGDPMPAGAAPADVQTDDSYLVDINLPGVAAEDLNPESRDNQLRLREVKDREHTGVLGRRGTHVGDFAYLLALPAQIDPNKGRTVRRILTARLRKYSADKPRCIQITG